MKHKFDFWAIPAIIPAILLLPLPIWASVLIAFTTYIVRNTTTYIGTLATIALNVSALVFAIRELPAWYSFAYFVLFAVILVVEISTTFFSKIQLIKDVKNSGGVNLYAAQNIAAIYCVLSDLCYRDDELLSATALCSTFAFQNIDVHDLIMSIANAKRGVVDLNFYRKNHSQIDIGENSILVNLAMQLVATELYHENQVMYQQYVDNIVASKRDFNRAVDIILKESDRESIISLGSIASCPSFSAATFPASP